MQRGHLHTEDIYIQQIQILVVIGMQFRLGTLQEAGRWMRERMDSETTDLFFFANIGRTTGLKPAVFWFVLIPSWLNCDVLANVPLSHLLCMVWDERFGTKFTRHAHAQTHTRSPNPIFQIQVFVNMFPTKTLHFNNCIQHWFRRETHVVVFGEGTLDIDETMGPTQFQDLSDQLWLYIAVSFQSFLHKCWLSRRL